MSSSSRLERRVQTIGDSRAELGVSGQQQLNASSPDILISEP